ncbi:MAG TPA: aromatic amino acid transport family protein [Candidatus Pacearchaeota archaeon]|nr:aromatic amino acid transport family protein [Candidatus Pacearchaeota archaeon]
MISKQIYSTSILAGSIIGAGLFSLPYIASKSGIVVMAFYLVFLGLFAMIIHLMVAEIALNSPDNKRLPGFAKLYLGKNGEKIALFSSIFGIIGTLLAYLIIGGEFLSIILGLDVFTSTLIYFALGALLIIFGIKIISKIELYGVVLFFVFLGLIFFKSLDFIDLSNLNILTNPEFLFLPYGPVLFSLWGISIVPEAEELLGKERKSLKKVVVSSFTICFIVYSFFIFLVLSVCGLEVGEASLNSLKNFVGVDVGVLAILFGIVTTFTSFITMGLTLQKIFWFDLKISKNISTLLTCGIPIILFLLGLNNFIGTISFVGGLLFGIDGILILLIYAKIKKRKRFWMYPFLILFVLGGIYEIITFLK